MRRLRMRRQRPSSVCGPRAVTSLVGIGDTLLPVVRGRWGRIAESAVEAMVARLSAHSRLTLQPDGGRVAVRLSASTWDFLLLLQPHLHFPSSMLFVQKLRPSLSVLLMERPGLTFFSPTARGRPQHVCRGPGSPRWPSVAPRSSLFTEPQRAGLCSFHQLNSFLKLSPVSDCRSVNSGPSSFCYHLFGDIAPPPPLVCTTL